MNLILCAVIVVAVGVLGLTIGRRGARRAERHVGAWAWIAYVALGLGMIFGATSVQHVLLSAFMWTKLTVFLATGLWLVGGRIRRGESVLPGRRAFAAAR